MSEISEERTLIAILQTRVMTLDADKSALEAENAKLKEALKAARHIVSDIDSYQKEPERGEWGVECACCMGELLDHDRETLAMIDAALT